MWGIGGSRRIWVLQLRFRQRGNWGKFEEGGEWRDPSLELGKALSTGYSSTVEERAMEKDFCPMCPADRLFHKW